ncbi:helix-turn-helix domain-containing protein [Mycetocola reblochoni]|uniref:HTH-type transcriptional regulator RipA n=2 Tax=Mycetocola reblochoni TaxID=331618 RepID=A0A1R4JHZ3_9MICO|nr:AraC family transcriptional regulator [Mycetocola reblochoni]RLP70511.1 AraC family transcriptional regulator [Mycetocola reblochoni]SJN31639.1 Transcriptional regulator, AraC family [Mycetocola reblochoni REB411]
MTPAPSSSTPRRPGGGIRDGASGNAPGEHGGRDRGVEGAVSGGGAWARDAASHAGLSRPLPAEAEASFVIVTESHDLDVSTEWGEHSHPAHELVWVRRGTMTSRVGHQVFTVSSGYGLWIPAGVPHSGRLTAGVELCDAFFAPERTPADAAVQVSGGRATVVVLSPVLESLLLYLADPLLERGARARAEAVVFDVLAPSERDLAVTVPEDALVQPLVDALLADPADRRSLEQWAGELGLSERTVTRAFRASTGLSFAQWRQSVRVHSAIASLAEGAEVGEVAASLGYAQAGTFIGAFRRVMGVTPGVFRAAAATGSALS